MNRLPLRSPRLYTRRYRHPASGAGERHRAGSAPVGSSEHRALVLALVESQRPYRNQPGGYWLAAATPEAGHHALIGRVPLTGPDRLTRAVLLTDGASRAVEVFGLYDWATLLQRADDCGPAAILADVRTAERADPLGKLHPRGKAHDDATIAVTHL